MNALGIAASCLLFLMCRMVQTKDGEDLGGQSGLETSSRQPYHVYSYSTKEKGYYYYSADMVMALCHSFFGVLLKASSSKSKPFFHLSACNVFFISSGLKFKIRPLPLGPTVRTIGSDQ